MADDDHLILAELLCARVCHDLSGPVGAVGTGAELLTEESDGLDADALALLASSAAIAGQRLRFLRLALGPGGAAVAGPQLREVTAAFLAGAAAASEAVRLDWEDGGSTAWENAAAKLLLNLVLLARDCLPRGGAILVRARLPGQPWASVVAEGQGAVSGEAMAGLTAGIDDLEPRSAQGYYAAGLASRLGLTIRASVASGRIELNIGDSLHS